MTRKQNMAHVNEYVPLAYVGKRTPVKVTTGSETLVEQYHEETTNINKIIARYRSGGSFPQRRGEPNYADVSQVGEFMDVRLQMSEAQQNYDNLPDFIKEKLPFADIGNVSDETLQEIFGNADDRGNEANTGATPTGTGEVPDGEAAPAGAGADQADTAK